MSNDTGSGAVPPGHWYCATTMPATCNPNASTSNGNQTISTVANNRPVNSATLETGRMSSASPTCAPASRWRASKPMKTKPIRRAHSVTTPNPGTAKRGAMLSL